jgi:hypothetical protein
MCVCSACTGDDPTGKAPPLVPAKPQRKCEWCRKRTGLHRRTLPGTKINLTLCDPCERVVGRQAAITAKGRSVVL